MSAELSTPEVTGVPAPRESSPWPRRVALLLIAALAGLSYAWSISQDTLEPYYAGAVRSMSASWHDFIFGAVDPAGTITLDKLPGAFWIQALAVRAFGFHTWVIIAPQAAEGILTAVFLYRAVSRLSGPAAGLLAALILAASPATVALNRGNISDSLMILLLVLAADAVSAAIASGPEGRRAQARLVLAAIWVGLAFQAKMIEAWLVLPALGLAYLWDGPGSVGRRVRQLVIAGIVAGLVSLAWMTAVSLVPASSRPYADGSQNNSVYAQVFSYNGFGRFSDQTPVQLLAGQISSAALTEVTSLPPATPVRLLKGNLGRDTGWLLPAALVAAIGGIVIRRRRQKGDGPRASFVLWGAWLVTLAVTFSAETYINTYYTAALTPAIAAIGGTAVALAWEPARRRVKAVILAVIVAGTVAYSAWLLPTTGAHLPGWLFTAVVAVGAVAVAIALASLLLRRGAVYAAALAAGVVACLLAPAVASAGLTASHESAFDTPFEPQRLAGEIASVPAQLARLQQVTVPRLESLQAGAPYLMAAQTAYLASIFIYASGREVLPIGGFTGTIPSPTLSQLQADIGAAKFHLVLALSRTDPRLKWIAGNCRSLSATVYFCVKADGG